MNPGNRNQSSFLTRTKILSAIVFTVVWLLLPLQSTSGQENGFERPKRPEPKRAWPLSLMCSRFVGQASRPEIAMTPRQQADLERLAIRMGKTFTANSAIYARVVNDVTAIRSSSAQLNYPYKGENDGKTITLKVDELTFERMKAGTYKNWDCLNDLYGLVQANYYAYAEHFVILKFRGIYNTDLLAQEYSRLPGVINGESSRLVGGGPDICGTIEGSGYHYVFDLASGDCPAGCIYHKYFYFTSAPLESPRFAGEWDPQTGPAPGWMKTFGTCYRF